MNKLLKIFSLILIFTQNFWLSPSAFSQTNSQPLKVGGDYQVSAVEHVGNREFKVEFKALNKTGKFDVLTLYSDHVHVAVRVGQKLRLSAEILSSQGDRAEVAQMVIYVRNQEGPTPVWLLSNKATGLDLKASKYIEMHSPITDYMVM